MKRNKFLVFLIFVIFSMSYSIDSQAKEAKHFEVNMNMYGNYDYTQGLNVTCYFTVFRNGQVVTKITITQPYIGDGEYYFDSDFMYLAGDSFIYKVHGWDSPANRKFDKTGSGNSNNNYVSDSDNWILITVD